MCILNLAVIKNAYFLNGLVVLTQRMADNAMKMVV